jgi:hypothetical protein
MQLKACLILFLVILGNETMAQIPAGSSARRIQSDVETSSARVSEIINLAQEHFRKGKAKLEDKKPVRAREEFDAAIDTILYSGLDVRANFRLLAFYFELVERIYQEEVPTYSVPANATQLVAQNAQNPAQAAKPPRIGFVEQKFDPSPFDELSRLVLSQDSPSSTVRSSLSSNERRDCGKAPTIRHVTLGMSLRDFQSLYPRSELTRKRQDVPWATFGISGIADSRLKGVSSLQVYFFEGRLYSLSVQYTGEIEWTSVEQFVRQFSKTTGLPSDWEGSSERRWDESSERQLRCKTFNVVARLDYIRRPTVNLQDVPATIRLIEREREMRSPARFRP